MRASISSTSLEGESAPADDVICIHRLMPCPNCWRQFDLFAAQWCAHRDYEPSKICPHCQRCLCEHPAYREPRFWRPAPSVFQKRGFRRLFLLYV